MLSSIDWRLNIITEVYKGYIEVMDICLSLKVSAKVLLKI